MKDYIKNKINTIKENKSYGAFIEVGAGLPTYNELCKHPNTASKIAYYAESPNSWEYNKKAYQHEPDVRAVSPQICLRFLSANFAEIKSNDENNQVNFILTNTVQIANDKSVASHGWFGYMNLETYKTRFYHYSINLHQSRKTQLDIIAKIGLDIIAAQGNSDELDNGYIDNILDLDFNQLTEETLIAMINGKLNKHNYHNTNLIINKNGEIERLNDFYRKNKDVIVFKGSFNPVHNQHVSLMEKCSELYPTAKTIFSISIDNRDPNKKTNVKNLMKRIELLNHLGYDVLIDVFGLYHYSYTTLTQNPDFKNRNLYYILGSDIIKRFLKDEYVYVKPDKASITSFNDKWNQCTFLWFSRLGIDVKLSSKLKNIIHIEMEEHSTSSTELRQLIMDKKIDQLNELGYTHKLYHNFLD